MIKLKLTQYNKTPKKMKSTKIINTEYTLNSTVLPIIKELSQIVDLKSIVGYLEDMLAESNNGSGKPLRWRIHKDKNNEPIFFEIVGDYKEFVTLLQNIKITIL